MSSIFLWSWLLCVLFSWPESWEATISRSVSPSQPPAKKRPGHGKAAAFDDPIKSILKRQVQEAVVKNEMYHYDFQVTASMHSLANQQIAKLRGGQNKWIENFLHHHPHLIIMIWTLMIDVVILLHGSLCSPGMVVLPSDLTNIAVEVIFKCMMHWSSRLWMCMLKEELALCIVV